jgi:signal transduction histidine kinase/CheY-like chemotaxis protein
MNVGQEILEILAEFGGDQGGRPGQVAVRFLLPAFFWTILACVAWREWRRTGSQKDRFIGIAAAVGLCRELLMFASEYGSARGLLSFEGIYPFYPPFEHAATMLSGVFIAAAFMNYILAWGRFSYRYLAVAAPAVLAVYFITAVFWPVFLKEHPGAAFGSFWGDMLFRATAAVFIGAALAAFVKGRVSGKKVNPALLVAFLFLFLDEYLMILNLTTHERHVAMYAPIRHNLHIWAIPLFLAVYWVDHKNRLQEALADIKQERLRSEAIIAAIGDGISIQDRGFKILFQNRINKDLIGDHAGKLCYVAYENKEALCDGCPVNNAFRDGKVHRAERTITLNNGIRVLEITASPLRDSEGEIIAGIELVRDVTEKKRLQEEALKSEKLESVGLLAGGLAHDFNNLLTTICGNISLAKLSLGGGHEACDQLEAAERATLRAADVTRQLLTFSRGGAPVKKASSIVDIIKESVTFTLSGSTVRPEFITSGPVCSVNVDPGQMSQVFNNLALNALQAMPNGGILRIDIHTVRLTDAGPHALAAGEYARIVVSDTGIGIPEDLQARIFDPYFTTKQKGSGLGLATAYSIIKKHDGLIIVESMPGKGTAFTVYLPASNFSPLAQKSENKIIANGRGPVLIMDDERAVRETAGAILTRLGYDCSYASDGEEALVLYQRAKEADNAFILVIMDLTVPGGMGGKDAIARLLALDPHARVIVSSGYANGPVMADHKRYGFKGVIAKPYNVEQLSRTVHAVLNDAGGASGF